MYVGPCSQCKERKLNYTDIEPMFNLCISVDGKTSRKPIPTSVLEVLPVEFVNSRIGKNSKFKDMGSQSAPHSGEEFLDSDTQSEVLLHNQQVPSSSPDFADNQTMPTRKKPPSLKQLNIARKRLRPQVIPTNADRLAESGASILSSVSLTSISSDKSPVLKDLSSETREIKEHIPEFPLWINRRRLPILRHPIQLIQHTSQPSMPQNPDTIKLSVADINTSLQADEPHRTRDLNAREENQDTTTSTIITTTVITTEQSPGTKHLYVGNLLCLLLFFFYLCSICFLCCSL